MLTMSYLSKPTTDAAFEAHMAAVDSLRTSYGRDPSHTEVAVTLAEAFGAAMGIYAGAGAQKHQIDAVNRIVERSHAQMLKTVMVSDSEGSA